MKKKLTIMTLSSLVALNSMSGASPVYAVKNKSMGDSVESRTNKSTKVIYVEEKNNNTYVADGSYNKPYKDIKTAIEKAQDGDTLIILGSASYTKYDKDEVGAALPLFINKKITIQGKDSSSSLSSRAPIQLGADVTFKDISLEMVPEVILGREAGSSESRMLGNKNPRSATIFAAGHKLTLDNVKTKVGSNSDDDRPYISGGTYKNNDNKIGKRSIINIINPNDETKFATIYAGDYWAHRNMDVEINIDENTKLLDRTIHAGGVNYNLNGTIDINLTGQNSIENIDKSHYSGDINVTLKKGVYNSELNLNGINDLTLENNVKLIIPENGEFDVNNVTLGESSIIDFRNMAKNNYSVSKNPTISGDFVGRNKSSNTQEYGGVFIANTQTLEISGDVIGVTKLNVGTSIDRIDKFVKGHEYVKADMSSAGTFSIEGTNEKNYKVKKSIVDNNAVWTIVEKDGSEELEDSFGSFEWNGGENKIILPSSLDELDDLLEYSFPVKFIDTDGEQYNPDMATLYDNFTYILEKNGEIIDLDNYGADLMWDEDELKLNIYIYTLDFADDLYGNYKLSLIHNETSAKITKNITIVSETSQSKELSGSVRIIGDVIEGNTISADISQVPSDCEGVKYEWYVDDKAVNGEDRQDFNLTSKHVGKSVKVKVTADNYSGSILSDSVIVKKKNVEVKPQPDEAEKVDKNELHTLYNDYEIGKYNKSDYTEDSFRLYEEAIKEAKVILNNEKSTQEEVNEVVGKIKKAIGGLEKKSEPQPEQRPTPKPEEVPKPNPAPQPDTVEKVDKNELQTLYNDYEIGKYNKSDYTEDSFRIYEEAIKEAKVILNNEKSTQEEVNAALEKLKKSINGLKKKSSSNSGNSSSGGSSNSGNSSSSSSGGSSSSGSSSGGGSGSTGNSGNSNNAGNSENNKKEDIKVDQNNNTKPEHKKTNWDSKDGKWYVKLEDGSNAKGWYKDQASGKWYMLDKTTGAMKTGWQKDDNGKWYHLDNSGQMNTGWLKDDNNKWYKLDNSGAMVTGWHKDTNGKWYHLDNSGAMNTGWLKDDNSKWYKLDGSGAMVTGWSKDTDGKWYHLDSSGAMNTGWFKDNDGKWYYLNSDGSMASNTTIDGYRLGKDGAWIR